MLRRNLHLLSSKIVVILGYFEQAKWNLLNSCFQSYLWRLWAESKNFFFGAVWVLSPWCWWSCKQWDTATQAKIFRVNRHNWCVCCRASIRTRIDVSFQHRTEIYVRTGPQEMRWSSAAVSVYHPFFFTPPPGGFRHRKTVSVAVFISLFIFAQCNIPRPRNTEQFTVRRWLIKHVAQSVAHIDISQASGDPLCHCLLVLRVCVFDQTELSILYLLLQPWWLPFPLEILC